MKCIIDTDQFEKLFETKAVAVLGIGDNLAAPEEGEKTVWTRIINVADLEELNSDYINEHFGDLQDTAYQKGINDGSLDVKQRVEGAYQRGFEDGKAVNDKRCEGCLYNDGTKEHSPCDICCNAYLNRWTAKQTDENVKRGDVVRHKINGLTYIVTLASDCGYVLLGEDGNFATRCITNIFEKTGKHFDIDKILEAMKA